MPAAEALICEARLNLTACRNADVRELFNARRDTDYAEIGREARELALKVRDAVGRCALRYKSAVRAAQSRIS